MSDATTNLGLPFLAAAQAQKHVTVNEALCRLDALVQGNVVSRTITGEPASPADGALYILPGGKTGAYWGPMANYALALRRDGLWEQIAPREGWTFYVRDEDVHVVFTGAVWSRLTQLDSQAGFRNRLINGRFALWQRGTSFSAAGYTADRWKLELSGSMATASRQTHTPGQTDVPGEPRYFMRLAATGGAGAGDCVRLVQPIEDVRSLAGQSAILSFFARRNAGSGNVSTELAQAFGSGGSPSADVTQIGAAKHTLTTSWQRFTVALTVPSISGKTPSSNEDDNLRILFWASAGSTHNSRTASLGQQTITIDIADVQIEPGAAATSFELRPFATELALCQRYFEKSFPLATAPAQNAGLTGAAGFAQAAGASTAQAGGPIAYRAPKRTAPAITLYNPSAANAQAWNAASGTDFSSTAAFAADAWAFHLTMTSPASTNAGNLVRLHWTADAEL
jgi:hypothetical protein